MKHFISTLIGGILSLPVFLSYIISSKIFGYQGVSPTDSFVLGLLVLILSVMIDLMVMIMKSAKSYEHIANIFTIEFFDLLMNIQIQCNYSDVKYKLDKLKRELESMKHGIVEEDSRDEIYKIDRIILSELKKNEEFLSTVPVFSYSNDISCDLEPGWPLQNTPPVATPKYSTQGLRC